MYRLYCPFCKLDCHGVTDFKIHLKSKKHRENARAEKHHLSSLQLQYVVETYLREEPVLGLEYIVEQEVDSSSFLYSCLLCKVRGSLFEALQHILTQGHVVRYIRQHHDRLWPKHPHRESLDEEALRDIAQAIQKKAGLQRVSANQTVTGVFPWLYSVKTNSSCSFCGVTFPLGTLMQHVKSKKHKTLVKQAAPKLLKEQEKLQYSLDTHFSKEPILGLEYIVEEFTPSSGSYKYTCLLCHVEYDAYKMVTHLMSCEHMTQYIDGYHSELSLSGKDYKSSEDFQRDLRLCALLVCKKGGKKTIQVRTSDVSDLDLSNLLPEEDDGKQNGDLSSKEQVEEDKDSCLKGSRALQPFPQDVKEPSDTAVLQEVENDCTRKPTAQKCHCSLCDVFSPSVFTHCSHIMGKGHRAKLNRATSEKVKEKDRLQYILDTFMKKAVILGLEYLVEQKEASSRYSYTCRLCDVKAGLSDTLAHILDKNHTIRYIEREHKDLLPEKCSTMSLLDKVFTETALEIQEQYGRKEIKVKNKRNSKEAVLPQIVAVEELEFKRNDTCSCSLCDTTFSVTDLNKHVMGEGHRINWERTSPELVEEWGRLKYLLDVYLKDYPLLGLEYILEMQKDSGYRYICILCNLETDCYQTIDHMTGEDHLTRYIDRHHRKLSVRPDMFPEKEEFKDALSVTAFHIYTKFGRRDIRVKLLENGGIGKRISGALEEKSPDPKQRRLENV